MPKFGDVFWYSYSGLTPAEKEAARAFAFDRLKTRSPKRIAAMEFGLSNGRIFGCRSCVPAAVVAADEDEDDAADPIEDEADDEDFVVCEECEDGVEDFDGATCRVCDDFVCDKCQSRHEVNCERWE